MLRTGLSASAIFLIVMAILSVYGWITIPEDAMIARHWNINGVADGFSPRNHILVGLPILALSLTALFAAIPAIDPRRANLKKSGGLFLSAWLGGVGITALAHGVIIVSAATGREADPGIVLYAVSLLLIVLGNFMAKSRSSWFIGFRTPWTLSSENAWVAANRTAGWLFVLTGVLTAGAFWFGGVSQGTKVLLAGVLAAVVVGFVVSYFVWRKDPDRQEL